MKYTDEEKQKFRDLVAGGKSLKDAASEAGISLAIGLKLRGEDNKKKRGDSPPPSSEGQEEKQEEQQEENLSEGDVPPPGSGGGGASDGSGARGADGARSALKDEDDDPEEEKEDDEKTEEEKKAAEEAAAAEEKKKNAADPAEVLVDLSEMLCSGMVWLFARRKKVKLTWEQKEKLAWSDAERAHLVRSARRAAAAIPGILVMLGPYVGLLFFGFMLFKVTESRCEQVAAWGPAGKEKDDSDEQIKDADWEEKKTDLNNTREDW